MTAGKHTTRWICARKACPNHGNDARMCHGERISVPVVTFWSLVRRSRSCWEWCGNIAHNGYGRYGYPKRYAHRLSWELSRGPIPPGLCVLHRCDNRRCVRPEHLFLGTKRENSHDMMHKKRWGRRYPALTPAQVLKSRALSAAGVSLSEIGRRMGHCHATISKAVRGGGRYYANI